MTDQVEFRARPAAWLARAAVALVFAAALAACDTADYTVDWFEDDDEEETAAEEDGNGESGAEGGSQQPTDRPFPNLSSVPERPGPPEIKLEAVSVKEGLTADKNNARYTDQALRSQTADVRPRPRVEKPADKPPAGAPTPADRAARPSAPPPPPPGTPAARRPPPPPPGSPAAERPAPEPAEPAQPAQAQVAAKPPAAQPAVSPSAPPRPAATETPAAKPKTVARPAPPPEPVTQDTAPERARPAPPTVAAATAPPAPTPAQQATTPAAPAPPQQQVTAATAPTPARQAPARAGTTTLVATIYFADGQTALTAEDLAVLRQVMDIQRQGGGTLRVVGHSSMSSGIADPARRRLVNFKVSLDRATIVAQSFRDMGLPGDRVAVEALGDAQPIYSEETAAGAAGNRRAEIFLDL